MSVRSSTKQTFNCNVKPPDFYYIKHLDFIKCMEKLKDIEFYIIDNNQYIYIGNFIKYNEKQEILGFNNNSKPVNIEYKHHSLLYHSKEIDCKRTPIHPENIYPKTLTQTLKNNSKAYKESKKSQKTNQNGGSKKKNKKV